MDLLSPIITSSGWVYSTGSLYLQDGNVLGRPMYLPDTNGERVYLGKQYKKYQRRPEINLCPVQPYSGCGQIDPWSVLIPSEQIINIVDTRQAFKRWLKGYDPRINIVKHVLNMAGIKISQCGLGGSTGLGCETPLSDIDLLIFGSASAFSCRRAIEDALLNEELQLMTSETVSAYAERYARLYNLDQNYLYTVFAHDLTKVYYKGQKISFIFTYDEYEREKIPIRLYTSNPYATHKVRMNARVIDSTASWLYPRKYVVEQLSGQLHQVWSHHWLRDPVTPVGTLVEIIGCDLGDGIISLTDLHHYIVPLIAQ